MLNQIVVVGRLVADLQVIEIGERKESTITLAVPRSYKNTEGEYDTDFIKCILWDGIAQNASDYCKKGDLIGVKGRVQSKEVDGVNVMEIIAEKITFLSSKKSDEE